MLVKPADHSWNSVFNRVIVPNPGRIQRDLYYDTPLAAHVPFQVPFQDRVVRIHYAVAICCPEGGIKFRGGMPDIGTYGIYRQDGKALPNASVFYEDIGQPDSSRWLPLRFNGSAPTPCWINGTAPPQAEYRSMTAPRGIIHSSPWS